MKLRTTADLAPLFAVLFTGGSQAAAVDNGDALWVEEFDVLREHADPRQGWLVQEASPELLRDGLFVGAPRR